VRLLGTPRPSPTARATARPLATQPAAQPTAAATAAANSGATPRPSPSPTLQAGSLPDRTTCDAIRGTPYRSDRERDFFLANCLPTATPTLEPAAAAQSGYANGAATLSAGLDAQIAYLIERAAAPALEDASWRQFTSQAAQNVKALAADLERLSPPACLTAAHGSLLQAARQAAAAADLILGGVSSANAGQVSQAGSALGVARSSLAQAAAAVRSASC